METAIMTALSLTTLASAHQQFEAALPAIESSGRYLLRHRRHDRDDLLAELTACAWKAWRGLLERGKDPLAVGISGIIGWAARHTLKGRRVGNRSRGGRGCMDVLNRRAQKVAGFRVISYDAVPGTGTWSDSPTWQEWLTADYRADPAEAGAFNVDFRSWLAGLPGRRRQTAELLAQGFATSEVAQRVGVSAAAISQARLWLRRHWLRFQGELVGPPA
jgi:hypothetical protein